MSIAKRYKSTSPIPVYIYEFVHHHSPGIHPRIQRRMLIQRSAAHPLFINLRQSSDCVFSSQRKYNLHRYRWNEQSQEVKENISSSYDMWLEITGALLNVAGSEELTILTHRKEGQPFGLAVVLEGWVMVARCWQRYYCLSLEDVWRWINPTKILFKLTG